MKLGLQTLTFLLTLPSALALATRRFPVNVTTNATITPPSTVNLTTNGTIAPPSRYYLQTRVKGYGNEDKNGLYVSGYHTGAGENDATLESIDAASVGFLNGTNQQFDYGTDFPWGMVMVLYDYYAEWDFVAINAGYGSAGFFFNETGLQYNQNPDGFSGWLVCDWWHGVPQLFWKFFANSNQFPSSCAQVDLLPVAV
ncbi:hypothetical protein HO173_012598 [Letharia columbiana]|uniref:DUF7907 domain-containing protein n=1 Tax=Letharia columbiana TaxID=112416 RepID=A0A8H6FFJ8_9LECA|nr:uncharacterized protein HO173_012598 [Letharia columbiana]KAF6226008.1 hypothetical protein HO173_012598 [Letharia columbiana]